MIPRYLTSLVITSTVALACAAVTGCGGGGGSDDPTFVGAANVTIKTTPSTIDSGDRTLVQSEISEVHENGISLKFRFAESLRYVPDSAVLLINNKEIELSPTVNKVSEDENLVYLVFYLKRSQFTKPGQKYQGEGGEVRIQLEGLKALDEGKIEIDADVDDPAENNSVEFSIDDPEFVSADETYIRVRSE
jgi:hypothetical protein